MQSTLHRDRTQHPLLGASPTSQFAPISRRKGHTLAKFVPVVVEQEQEDMVRNTPLRPAMNVETTSQLGLWWWDTSMPFDGSGLTTMENPLWWFGQMAGHLVLRLRSRSMKPDTSGDP